MGPRIHAYDWATTPAGPIETWPASLAAAVSLMLAMPQAACIYWGPEALFLYNDDFRGHIGDKHPHALAQPFAEIWPELEEAVRPGLNAVMSGESLHITDQEFVIANSNHGHEPRWFTGSWTPISDDMGQAGGVFCVMTETTEHVLTMRVLRRSEERREFLLTLSDALRPLASAGQIKATAARLLGQHLHANRVYYAEIDNGDFVIEHDYARDLPPMPGRVPMSLWGKRILDEYRSGASIAINDVHAHPLFAGEDVSAYDAAGLVSGIGVPLVKDGIWKAALGVANDGPRDWTESEVRLAEDVAERTWAAIERARAEESLRWSEARLAGQKEAFQAAVNGAPLAEALGVLIRSAIEQMGGRARCAFYIADDAKTSLSHVVGMPDSYARSIDGFKVGPDSLSCGLAVYTGRPITTADVTKDPLWHDWLWLAEEHEFRACWSFPIETTTGNYVGTFAMYFREPREASASDSELAGTMTRAAAIIIARYQETEERKRAERAQLEARQAAEEAARAREEFLSIASHELRNPVTTLVGTAQQLRHAHESGRLTEERLNAYLGSLERAGNHLAVLTNDLLDVARLERGELPLRPESTDIAELLRDIVSRGEWPGHHVTLEVAEEPPEVAVLIDPDRIRQLVTNLLDNAVKYSPAADEVRLRLRRDSEELLIEVEDFGIGLPPGSTNSIFTPFNRAPNADRAGIPGLGLGLYISRRIAEQHGGRLLASSMGEDLGTVMSLWLPLPVAEGARPLDDGRRVS